MNRESDLRLCGITLCIFAVFVLALFTACASVPLTETRVINVPVENQLVEPVDVYLNGTVVAHLVALESRSILFPESRLVEGRCIYAQAVLKLSGFVLSSGRECISAGGRFTVSIAVGNHLWLNAWQ